MSILSKRSVAFHLWVRLTAVIALFMIFAIGIFLWREISRDIDAAKLYSEAQAEAAVKPFVSSLDRRPGGAVTGPNGNPVDQAATAATLGVRAIQLLRADGSVVENVGDLAGESASSPADTSEGKVILGGYDIRLSDGGFVRSSISPLDLLMGGDYGSAYVLITPPPQDGRPSVAAPIVRVILSHDHLSEDARTLLLGSLGLAGGILVVATLAIWVLLNHFVARPLRAYNATARSIAGGEIVRMHDLGIEEFEQLGQTINEMASALRNQARIDVLTGLFNVRDLRSRLPELLQGAIAGSEPLAILVADLDNLKPVNDTYGHHAGDMVLRAAAEEFVAWAADDCICWRTGGDEFVAVMPATSRQTADGRAGDLGQRVSAAKIDVAGGSVSCDISIGVAAYPDDGETVEELLSAADRRMYEAKTNKRELGLAIAS